MTVSAPMKWDDLQDDLGAVLLTLISVSPQSQLCNSIAQAMSCCPHHAGDMQLGPEATTTTLPIPRSLSCMPRHPGKLPQGGLSAPMLGTPLPRAFQPCAATRMCGQVKLTPLCPVFPAPTLSCRVCHFSVGPSNKKLSHPEVSVDLFPPIQLCY